MSEMVVNTSVLEKNIEKLTEAKNYYSSKKSTFGLTMYGSVSDLSSALASIQSTYQDISENIGLVESLIKDYKNDVEAVENRLSSGSGNVRDASTAGLVNKGVNSIVKKSIDASNIFTVVESNTFKSNGYSDDFKDVSLKVVALMNDVVANLEDGYVYGTYYNRDKEYEYIDCSDKKAFKSKLSRMIYNKKIDVNDVSLDEIYIYYKYLNEETDQAKELSLEESINAALMLREYDYKEHDAAFLKRVVELPSYEIKDGTINPIILNEASSNSFFDGKITTTFHTRNHFEGEYAEFYDPTGNIDGPKIVAPLYKILGNKDNSWTFTPLTEKEKEEYLQNVTKYYGLVFKNSNDFSDLYMERLNEIDYIIVPYYDEKDESINDYSGFFCANTLIVFYNYLNLEEANVKQKSFAEEVFVHESGHAVAEAAGFGYHNELRFGSLDNNAEWESVYRQLKERYDSGEEFHLSDYAFKNKKELFAESTAEYWNASGNSHPANNYNREDLKKIDIELYGKTMTLYDYMYKVLN